MLKNKNIKRTKINLNNCNKSLLDDLDDDSDNDLIINNNETNDSNNSDDSDDDESDNESDDDTNEEQKIEKKIDNPSISTIYHNYFTRKRINLQPNYQREFTWSIEKMNTFIDSLMKGYVIPTFILYKLSNEEKKKEKKKSIDFECIDGQHRLTVLQKFMNSEAITIGSYDRYIFWNKIIKDKFGNKTKEKVFYKLTPEIKFKYRKLAREMTFDEKNYFDDIQLQFNIIQSKLNDTQKCDIFNRLQNGEKVSSIIKVKNISHPITDYLRNNNIICSKIIDEWNDIIKIKILKNGLGKNNYLIDHFTYLVIRLILIYSKKSLDINYLNLNIRKYLENNYAGVQINDNIDKIYKNILKIKKNIVKKFNGYTLISELFIIIFFIKINVPEKFDIINKKIIKEIFENYNNLDKYKMDDKNKVVSKDIMNKFYNEIISIIDKN